MNILVLANEDEGLFQFRGELLIELLKEHKVFTSVPEGNYTDDLEAMGCTVLRTALERHGINPIQDISLLLKYNHYIKTIKPDLVLTYTIKPNVYGGFVCGIRKIPFFANITGLGTAVEYPGLMQKITILLYKIGLRKATKVFFQNQYNKEFMQDYKIVGNNYRIIPGSGVNLSHYYLQPFPKERVEFAFISRIMKEKGIDQYLEAAEYIKKKHPEIIFHICGYYDGSYENTITDYQNRGVIKYHGNLRDVRDIHKVIQCTIHPTYYPEGLSNVLLESAASGRAIITTNRSGCKEVVDDGVNGFVVRERDTEDLIRKIEQFISLSWEERRNMGLNGRAKVEREFNRQIVIDAYLEEINKLW